MTLGSVHPDTMARTRSPPARISVSVLLTVKGELAASPPRSKRYVRPTGGQGRAEQPTCGNAPGAFFFDRGSVLRGHLERAYVVVCTAPLSTRVVFVL